MAFLAGFNHIVHLTEEINEENRLMIEVLKPMDDFFIEVFHLVRGYYLVIIKINDREPILE